MGKPDFNPDQPFESVKSDKPAFDPHQSFEKVEAPQKMGFMEETGRNLVNDLPAIGGVVGGVLGTPADVVAGPLGNVAGAGIGGYLGTATKNLINHYIDPQNAPQTSTEAMTDPVVGGIGQAGMQAGGELAAPILAAGASKVASPVYDYLRQKAGKMAVQSTKVPGVTVFNKFPKNAGETLLDRGIVGFGDTQGQIAKKATSALDETGEKIGSSLKDLDSKGASVPKQDIISSLRKRAEDLSKDPSSLDVSDNLIKLADRLQTQLDQSASKNTGDLLTYHGTNKDFKNFEIPKEAKDGLKPVYGKGVYLADKPFVADGYANQAGANVRPTYLNTQKPFNFYQELPEDIGDQLSKVVGDKISKQATDYLEKNGNYGTKLYQFLSKISGNDPEFANEVLKKMGHDSLNIENESARVAFDPSQLRSQFELPESAKTSLSDAEQIKRGFQNKVNYNGPALDNSVNKEAAGVYQKAVENNATAMDPGLGQQFKEAKDQYSALAPIEEATAKKASVYSQGPAMNLHALRPGAIGGLIGGEEGYRHGGIAGGLAGATAGAILGPRVMSSSAVTTDMIAKLIKNSPQSLGKWGPALIQASESKNPNSLPATDYILQQNDEEYRNHMRNLKGQPLDENK